MSHESVIDELVSALVGVPEDILGHVLDAVDAASLDLSDFSHDDVIKVVSAAVSSVAGAATTHYLARNRETVGQAIRQSLAAG